MSDTDQVHLREYIERILDEREKALELTAKNLEHRLEHMNALREEVLRIEGELVTKEACEDHRSDINSRLSKLEQFQSRLLGIGIVYGLAAGIIGAIAGHVFIK